MSTPVDPTISNGSSTYALLAALTQVVPVERVQQKSVQLAPYESDALTAFQARPAGVVLAETQDEVIEIVRLCHQYNVPFVARGSGTSLSGGSLPIADGIVIALNRLNRIVRFDPDERVVVVEPGVVNLDVSKLAAPHDLYYAPDPFSQLICTIGGNVAFNSGGAHCLKYGMTANHVLGIKAVLPDGEGVQLGGDSLESVGPDLRGFFVGCEGLFGIALEVTLRLLPKPKRYCTVLAAYDSLETAGDAVAQVVASGLLPDAMEIMDTLAIEAAEASVDAGYPQDAAALLIVELEGERIQVEAEFEDLLKVIHASGATEVRQAADEDERARIWKGRKGAFSAVGRLSPDYIVQDGVVPRGRLGEVLATIERLSAAYDLRVANVFHAGDGNLHPLILYDGREEGALPSTLGAMLDLLPDSLPKAEPLPEVYPAQGETRARVALLSGCVQQVLSPSSSHAALRVLARNGVGVIVPRGQGCCGSLAMHNGEGDHAGALARRNLTVFGPLLEQNKVDAVITNAAGCGSGMKEYGLLFKGPRYEERARLFAERVEDVSAFLDRLRLVETPPILPEPLTVAYYDACHLAHAQGVTSAPRRLLRSIPNLTVVEIPEGEICCGSAGTYNLEQPEIAHELGNCKVEHILQTGAAGVVTGNIGCMTQTQTHLGLHQRALPMWHTVELLDIAYGY